MTNPIPVPHFPQQPRSESDAKQQNRNDSGTEFAFGPKTVTFFLKNPPKPEKSHISNPAWGFLFDTTPSPVFPWPSQSPALPEPLLRPRTSAVAAGAGGPRGARHGLIGACCCHSNPFPCPPDPWGSPAATGAGKATVHVLEMEPHPGTRPGALPVPPGNRRWLKREFVPIINH